LPTFSVLHSGCTAVNLISSLQFCQMSSTPAHPGPLHLTPNLGTQYSSPPPASHTQQSTFSKFLTAVTGQKTTLQDDQHAAGQRVDCGEDIHDPQPSPTRVETTFDRSSGDPMPSSPFGIRTFLMLFTRSPNITFIYFCRI